MFRNWILTAVVVGCSCVATSTWATPFAVDQANDGLFGTQGYTTGGSASVMGQSFTPTASFLDHVELQMNAQSLSGSTTVHIDIMTDPLGAVLGSSGSLTFTTSTIQLGHFEFAVPVALTPGGSHFMRVVRDSGLAAGAFIVGSFGTDSYAGGAAYLDNAPCCDGFQQDDLWFRTGLTGAVPEPATLLLLGLALAGLGFARRRLH